MERSHWCTNDPDYIRYHDTEWGVPSRDPHHLFEKLVLEGFQAGTTIVNHYPTHDRVPTVTPQAQAMSTTLKKLGFRFVGPTICQSYLQAVGCFMDHTTNCHRHAELARV
jgi:3-methyladenine DNA glycosylase Tag